MKYFKSIIILGTAIFALNLISSSPTSAGIFKGQTAPGFVLKDLNGNRHDFEQFKDQPMLILYFFDAESRSSQEGLISLNELAKQYEAADLLVWGITRSPRAEVRNFTVQSDLDIPILLDTSNVCDLYNARIVLPTVCIIGPQSKVLHHFQGGGKSTEIMLTRLAEVQLQRGQPTVATAISEQIIKQNPKNIEAITIKAYAELDAGKPEAAENTLNSLPSDQIDAEIIKQEGLAEVYLKRGEFEKAWSSAQKLEQESPDRASAHAIKGEILSGKGKIEEAEKEWTVAAKKKSTFAYQKSAVINKLGLKKAKRGQNKEAIELYRQAEDIDPYNIEATSNKGLVLEEEGQLDLALKAYRQALVVNKDDIYASVFARRVQERLAIENDIEKKNRMDMLVKELAERYRQQKSVEKEEQVDSWTSRPMVLSFVNLKESGGLPDRDGFVLVLADQLSEYLNSSDRLKVVERRLIEKIIDELNLGTSDLADPQTALKLGRLFAAKIICTGSIHYLPNETLVSLRLMDTETSMIAKVFTRQIASGGSLDRELRWLNKEILKTIINQYPLRGYIVDVQKNQTMINIGDNQGVVLGTQFAVLKESEPTTYKGKQLKGAPKTIAQLEVIKVEPDFCLTRIVTQDTTIQRDDKIEEVIANL